MTHRTTYDLGHYSMHAGNIGRLSCLSVIPIVAGDSMGINVDGVFRLSPLRRNLTVDCKIDLFAFYVPHRQIYGSDWTDMVKEGVDTATTLTAGPTPSDTQGYLGQPAGWDKSPAVAIPLWLIAGYNRIWNRYFRHPSDPAELADTAILTSLKGREYGRLCAYPKSIWTTPLYAADIPAAADREVASASVLDLVDLAQTKARYKTELELAWFTQRYSDIMARKYGGAANTEADQRPTLIARKSSFMSGYDVDGTDDASLGSYSGKAASIQNFNISRKYFPEHGTVFIMALLRFPIIHDTEAHYLATIASPTYKEIMADPVITAEEEPFLATSKQFFPKDDNAGAIGYVPFGQWWRTHPSYVHTQYDQLNGFPFLHVSPTTEAEATYIGTDDYAPIFQTTQLGEWQSQCRIQVEASRVVPPTTTSIMAGT